MVMTVVDHLQKKVMGGEEGVVDHFQKMVMEGGEEGEEVVDHFLKMMMEGEEEEVDHLQKKVMEGEGEEALQKKVVAAGEVVAVEAQASEVSNFSLLPKIKVIPGKKKKKQENSMYRLYIKTAGLYWIANVWLKNFHKTLDSGWDSVGHLHKLFPTDIKEYTPPCRSTFPLIN